MARPTNYTPEMAAEICKRIMDNRSLRNVCEDPDMPARSTVFLWLNEHDAFSDQYARACQIRQEIKFDEIEDLAAMASPEDYQVKKLQIDTRKWVLSKEAPKKYGDKISQEISGKDGGPIETKELSDNEVARRMAFLLTKAAKGK